MCEISGIARVRISSIQRIQKPKKYYRNYSNRLVRRGKIGGAGKGGYRRSFDYKWEVY